MPSIKPQLIDAEVRTLLTDHYAAPDGDLTVLEGGQIALTVAFAADGAEYILKLQHLTMGSFAKDVYVYEHYAAPNVPIPRIYRAGQAGNLYYAIFQRMPGHNMIGMSHAELDAYVPALIATLDAIHASDVSGSSGYGAFDEHGVGMYGSWRETILGIDDEQPPDTFYGKWHSLFDDGSLERDVWDRIRAAMVELLDYCPEERWLLHADYAYGNVLVEGGRITAVLDWANALYGDFLFDIAWLNHVLPDHQIPDRCAEFYAAQGRHIPHYRERLRCYRYLIALDSMRYCARVGRRDDYITMRDQTLATL